jgi:hypothetical protein
MTLKMKNTAAIFLLISVLFFNSAIVYSDTPWAVELGILRTRLNPANDNIDTGTGLRVGIVAELLPAYSIVALLGYFDGMEDGRIAGPLSGYWNSKTIRDISVSFGARICPPHGRIRPYFGLSGEVHNLRYQYQYRRGEYKFTRNDRDIGMNLSGGITTEILHSGAITAGVEFGIIDGYFAVSYGLGFQYQLFK